MDRNQRKAEKALERQADRSASGFSSVNRVQLSDIVIMLVLSILCLLCILPFIHIAAKSLSGDSAVLGRQVGLLPVDFSLRGYERVFASPRMPRGLLISVVMTATFTVIGMVITVCAAYPLSRRRLKGRRVIGLMFLITLYFAAGTIPDFVLFRDLGLLNSIWVLILPLCFSPYNMLIMKSYFQSTIPESLEEAAFLDGANNFQIVGSIVLPLSKPIIATLSLFYAVGRWNAYADAKYFIQKRDDLQPLQLILANLFSGEVLVGEAGTSPPPPELMQAAAVMFTTIPILLIYPFVQRYFVRGVMIGAVKG